MLRTNRLSGPVDPWKLWSQLHNELNDFWGTAPMSPDVPINLHTRDDEAFVLAEIPGRSLEDIQVSAHRDQLTIEVAPSSEVIPEHAQAVRNERPQRHVTRQVRLPFEIDAERIDARYGQGVLRVHLPRLQSTMPQKITVKAG